MANKVYWRANFPKDALTRLRSMYQRAEKPSTEIEDKSGFNQEELEEIKDVFRYFDRDHNKHLDNRELNDLFKFQIGTHLHPKNFETVFRKIDLNADKKVSFPEFIIHQSSRKRKLPSSNVINQNFHIFDRNEDGFLNLDEIRHVLLYMGEEAGRIDLRRIFVDVDKDKDGLINRKEFSTMLREHFDRD